MKPKCKLSGENGNIYNLMGKAQRVLRQAGLDNKANEMLDQIHKEAKDYDHAIRIIAEYVEVS